MNKRIFIAINLPEDVKKQLVKYQEKYQKMFGEARPHTNLEEEPNIIETESEAASPVDGSISKIIGKIGVGVKWTKPENLHITLLFIGYADEEGILEIKRIMQNFIACPVVNRVERGSTTGVRQKSFFIKLEKISYGPPKINPPRMVWAIGERSENFNLLCDKVEEALASSPKIHFEPENRETIPHITLARIKEWEWRRIEPDERPEIEEDINLSFEVKSIELMESRLKRGGPEYTIIESYPL